MRPEAAPWWRQAAADLDAARQNLGLGIWYMVSWLAQQATEKGLKAVHIEQHGTAPPRIHDLLVLARQAGASTGLDTDLQRLNPRFAAVRYPDFTGGDPPVDTITSVIAHGDLAAAERVVEWIRQQLGV